MTCSLQTFPMWHIVGNGLFHVCMQACMLNTLIRWKASCTYTLIGSLCFAYRLTSLLLWGINYTMTTNNPPPSSSLVQIQLCSLTVWKTPEWRSGVANNWLPRIPRVMLVTGLSTLSNWRDISYKSSLQVVLAIPSRKSKDGENEYKPVHLGFHTL